METERIWTHRTHQRMYSAYVSLRGQTKMKSIYQIQKNFIFIFLYTCFFRMFRHISQILRLFFTSTSKVIFLFRQMSNINQRVSEVQCNTALQLELWTQQDEDVVKSSTNCKTVSLATKAKETRKTETFPQYQQSALSPWFSYR